MFKHCILINQRIAIRKTCGTVNLTWFTMYIHKNVVTQEELRTQKDKCSTYSFIQCIPVSQTP